MQGLLEPDTLWNTSFPNNHPALIKRDKSITLSKKNRLLKTHIRWEKVPIYLVVFNIQFCSSHPERSTCNAACEDSYLTSIFRPSSFDWQTFHHVYTAFWCIISFCNHHKSPLKNIGNIAMFYGWRPDHDVTIAGARGHFYQWGLSIESMHVFQPISCCNTMIITSLIGSRPSGTLVENERSWRSRREVLSAKTLKSKDESRPSIKNRIVNLLM